LFRLGRGVRAVPVDDQEDLPLDVVEQLPQAVDERGGVRVSL
jgi:hypothetical protein